MENLKIGKLAKKAKVKVETVRYYERRGLLPDPPRRESGYRMYSEEETVALVNRIACASCNVTVLDMKDPKVASRAKSLSIHSVLAVVIDGKLAGCCAGSGPDEATLKAAGIGQSL